jgi:hypothetical protein
MSNIPLIGKSAIVAYIRQVTNTLTPIVEVSDVYPSADDVVAYGIYVDDVSTISREVNQLGTTPCGSIYTMTDQFQVLVVSYQNDPQWIFMETRIQDMGSDSSFFNGYYEVTWTQDVVIGNRSEKRTYTFNLKRLNFNS